VVVYLDEEEIWGNEVDIAWLKKPMASYPKAHVMAESQDSKPLWDELEDTMPAGQNVRIYWPVGLVLATRR
jgi:hypothetical protein